MATHAELQPLADEAAAQWHNLLEFVAALDWKQQEFVSTFLWACATSMPDREETAPVVGTLVSLRRMVDALRVLNGRPGELLDEED